MTDDDIKGVFRRHADNCRDLGSPFVARLCDLFCERLEPQCEVTERLINWPERNGWGSSVPLRVIGALHALVLDGRSNQLTAVFPPNHDRHDDEILWNTVRTAMSDHAEFILERLESAPQTNEVRRAATLLPGFLTIASHTGLPMVMAEIGASAGLNLYWDRYGYQLGEIQWGNPVSPVQMKPAWTGSAPPLASVEIFERGGCDLAPFDPANESDRARLFSYIWADQTDRIDRTRAALDLIREEKVRIETADVLEWLPGILAQERVGHTLVIYHTIVWHYLDKDVQDAAETMIRAAGVRASNEAPVAWLRLEPDDSEPGAGLLLAMWPEGSERCIGRADFHGRWVDWYGW